MKSVPALYAAVAVVAAVMLFSGVLNAQSLGQKGQPGEDSVDVLALLGPQADDDDLNACQQDCRSRFGYDVYANPQYRRGSGRSGSYYAYAACIAECNRRFWKSFDKEMDELERE